MVLNRVATALAALLVILPAAAASMTLEAAVAAARRANPTLMESRAHLEAAEARLDAARAGRLPTLSITGQAGAGTTDLGGFFGFRRTNVTPRGAALQLRQPIFAGGAINAGVARARSDRQTALAEVAGAGALLAAGVAQAYVDVLTAGDLARLHEAEVGRLAELERQGQLRFKDGEIARTDLAEAQARLAEARAGLLRSQGDIVRTRAHFAALVGVQADGLETLPASPPTPPRLEDAVDQAARGSPTLAAAEAAERAAREAVTAARAERLPEVALAATAATSRDNFFPGYRADGVTVGVEGRWALYSGGAVSARVREAEATARAAAAALDAARSRVREAVIGAWQDVDTDRALTAAAADEAAAAAAALESARNEVRVGQRPMIVLLDAEREDLAARSALAAARGAAVADAWRLRALLNGA